MSKKGTQASPEDLMTPSDVAHVLGVSADSIRLYADHGKLPAMRTVTGRRLFRRGDVEAFRDERRKP